MVKFVAKFTMIAVYLGLAVLTVTSALLMLAVGTCVLSGEGDLVGTTIGVAYTVLLGVMTGALGYILWLPIGWWLEDSRLEQEQDSSIIEFHRETVSRLLAEPCWGLAPWGAIDHLAQVREVVRRFRAKGKGSKVEQLAADVRLAFKVFSALCSRAAAAQRAN